MSVVNLSNHNPGAGLRFFFGARRHFIGDPHFMGEAFYPKAIDPTFAMSFGKDVLDLTTLQPNAFFDKPLTDELASQPLVNQRVAQAWLKLANPKPGDTLLDPDLEQTVRLLNLAESIDGALETDTEDAFVILMEPTAVLLPPEEFQITTEGEGAKGAKLVLPATEKVQPSIIYTELSGFGDVTWHDRDTGILAGGTGISSGDIALVKSGYPSSLMNLSLTSVQIVLVQTIAS